MGGINENHSVLSLLVATPLQLKILHQSAPFTSFHGVGLRSYGSDSLAPEGCMVEADLDVLRDGLAENHSHDRDALNGSLIPLKLWPALLGIQLRIRFCNHIQTSLLKCMLSTVWAR